jgi:hypothetical protein
MYYLRADQAHLVQPLPGNVDPVKDRDGLLFRFPFPDEDHIEPGDFEDFNRGLAVSGVPAPDSWDEHYTVQFKADKGYLASLPCPEDSRYYEARQQPYGGAVTVHKEASYNIHRNGFSGAVEIVRQRYYEGRLVLVCCCGGCGVSYRLPTLRDAELIIVACRQQADHESARDNNARAEFWHTVADRITAGYLDGGAKQEEEAAQAEAEER